MSAKSMSAAKRSLFVPGAGGRLRVNWRFLPRVMAVGRLRVNWRFLHHVVPGARGRLRVNWRFFRHVMAGGRLRVNWHFLPHAVPGVGRGRVVILSCLMLSLLRGGNYIARSGRQEQIFSTSDDWCNLCERGGDYYSRSGRHEQLVAILCQETGRTDEVTRVSLCLTLLAPAMIEQDMRGRWHSRQVFDLWHGGRSGVSQACSLVVDIVDFPVGPRTVFLVVPGRQDITWSSWQIGIL